MARLHPTRGDADEERPRARVGEIRVDWRALVKQRDDWVYQGEE